MARPRGDATGLGLAYLAPAVLNNRYRTDMKHPFPILILLIAAVVSAGA